MDVDVVIWLGVLAFVLVGWIYVAAGWGFVERVDADGFTLRTILRTRRLILWDSLDSSVQQFTSFLPRFLVRLRKRRFIQMRSSFAILLRSRSIDQAFANEIQRRFAIVPVERPGDLWKR